MLENVFVMASS